MDSAIHFGKNIISILTSGMYIHPEFLFREYIQNAADQIDKDRGKEDSDERIRIYLDANNREIRIEDNATGIPNKDVHRILGNIAASEKVAGTDKGMFGIGRLGGLSYCETLVFETSYRGENTATIMTWDAKKLLDILPKSSIQTDAATLISSVISTSTCTADTKSHYFKVILKNIPERFSFLLDKERVLNYLRMTAPVKVDERRFSDYGKVREFLRTNNISEPPTYRVFLNDEEIRKPYHTFTDAPARTDKQKIKKIETKIFTNEEGHIQAWAWVGIRDFSEGTTVIKQDCVFRAIRLRLHNIQIGGEDTLTDLYNEDRAAKYFVGEIHVLDTKLTPNARRDYFEHTPEFDCFQNQVRAFLNKLFKQVRNDSQLSSVRKQIKTQEGIIAAFQDKQNRGFIDKEEREEWEKKKNNAEAERTKAIQKYKRLAPDDITYSDQPRSEQKTNKSETINGNENGSQTKQEKKAKGRIPLITDNLNGYKKSEIKLISKILKVITRSLKSEPEKGEQIVNEIIETLKK